MAQLYYSPVTVQTGQVPSTQTDFPVLVSYTDNRLKTTGNGGHVNNANGYDIRPYSDSGLSSALTFELEFYDAANGIVAMWVKIPSLADGYVVYLGYGDTSLTTNGSSTATWNSNFKGVYHLKDGTTLSVADSTGANNGTNNGATATTGKVDGGAHFVAASSQYIALGQIPALLNTQHFTMSAWVKTTSTEVQYGRILGWYQGNSNDISLSMNGFALANNQELDFDIFTDGSGAQYVYTSSTALTSGTFALVHAVFDGTLTGSTNRARIYINGSLVSTTAASLDAFPIPATTPSSISTNPDIAGIHTIGPYYFGGDLDEVRYLDNSVTANWITTEYRNQSAPSTFAVLGTEVPIGGSSAIKTINGLAKASVKVVNGLAIASVKTWNGLA